MIRLFALHHKPDYEQRYGGWDCLCSVDSALSKETGVFASSMIDFILHDHRVTLRKGESQSRALSSVIHGAFV